MAASTYVPADVRTKLLPLKDAIAANFTLENWLELGVVTDCLEIVKGHERLLRSLRFGDDDYPGAVLDVLIRVVGRDAGNLAFVERYVAEKFGGETVSSTPITGRRIVFAPTVFAVPDAVPDPTLVSVMMPFGPAFAGVHGAIKAACTGAGLQCQRVDDIWEHSTIIQDVFSLIFRSHIVVCDFSGKNPNVFYEAGIAHTLGKHVVPITQSADDVPFDLQQHRYVRYLNNGEGLTKLRDQLEARLRRLAADATH